MTKVDVIDISRYQQAVDFTQVRSSGVLAVIAKATEGTTWKDPYFARNKTSSLDAGLGFSSYHYLKHDNIQAQIDHYIDMVEPVYGERLCLDFEDPPATLEDLHRAVEYLFEYWPDQEITIYAGHHIKKYLGKGEASKHDPLLAQTSLWLAHYAARPEWPQATWKTWSLWQYSESGSVAGVKGNVDCNRFNGSPESCLAWIGPAPSSPEMPQPDAGGVVSVAITAPPGITVSVSVNGEVI